MTVSRPNWGTSLPTTLPDPSLGRAPTIPTLNPNAQAIAAANARNRWTPDGRWRPDTPFVSSHGVRITLRREPGVTTGDVLRVPFRFPAPAINDLSRTDQFEWATYDTLRLGQRSRPDGKQLMSQPVSTLMMDEPAADASSGVIVWDGVADPQAMLQELRWIMGVLPGSQAQVFRLVLDQPAVWGYTPILSILANLVSLDSTQKVEEVGTEYVDMTFQQFSSDSVQRKQRPASTGATRRALRAGDTLYSIATYSHFHAASAWKVIANANGITGVSPSSAPELAAWATRHHKTQITIPALTIATAGTLVGEAAA